MPTTRVLWLSRHHPGVVQLRELRRIFGEIEVVIDEQPITSGNGAEDIVGRMRSGQFDEIVLVAPTSILDELCRRGIRPLWPTMSRDRRTFLGFDRIDEIRKNREDVQPVPGNHKRVMWLSRFAPSSDRQTAELQRLFGSDVVVRHCNIPNAEDAADEFESQGYDAIVAVVPEAVFERLSALELPLIRSEAVKEHDPAKVEFRGAGGQGFRFDRYVWYRVEKVTTRL